MPKNHDPLHLVGLGANPISTEHTSASHLLQMLKEDDFASEVISPSGGIEKSSFSEANNTRGLDQFLEVFQELYTTANQSLDKEYAALGELVAIDGSLIDSVLSMAWADYRTGSKKAKAHIGFDLNRGIPRKIFLSNGKDAERPFVNQILESGQTGVMDRGYHCHKNFDLLQNENKHSFAVLKAIQSVASLSAIIFYDALVLLGRSGHSQTKKELRLVGYKVDGTDYWIATDQHDLSAEQIAMIYKLRWDIENFFAWWKRHPRFTT